MNRVDYGMVVVYHRDRGLGFRRAPDGIVVPPSGWVVVPNELWAEVNVSCARRLLRWLRLEKIVLG